MSFRTFAITSIDNEIAEITHASSAALPGPEDVLQSFYDSAPMMMGVVEVVGDEIIHLSYNVATARLMGVEPGAVKGRKASELGLPEANIWR